MYFAKILDVLILFIVVCEADWVEIPQMKPISVSSKMSGSTSYTESKTPVNVVFHAEQIENVEARNNTSNINNDKQTTQDSQPTNLRVENNRITAKPAKSSIMEVFIGSGTSTPFTPLMSSISVPTTSTPTTASPTLSIRPRPKGKTTNKKRQRTGDEPAPENKSTPENKSAPNHSFNSYTGFMPFLKSIQSILMQRAQKSIKSKIQVLTELRDNLLFDIDRRLRRLWSTEDEGRGHKDEHHLEFPSNEGALMTIGFLTLATFLVKLVLQVISAINAKKAYYNNTTTTVTTGRKRRFAPPDVETTYKILTSIDDFHNHNIHSYT